MPMTTYNYDKLKSKYGEFSYPMVRLVIGGKDFAENGSQFVLSDLEVDLSVGAEASVVTFCIYNSFDGVNNAYLFAKMKSYILLGSDVKVSLGYADKFTEVFTGFISQVEFVSRPGDPHHVEVTAMDAKGMMMSNCYARQMQSSSYGQAVKEIFNKPLYQKMQSFGIITGVKVTDTPDKEEGDKKPTSYSVEMVSESDYEFVVKAARRFNYEFYVDNGTIIFRKGKNEKPDCLLTVGIGSGLIYYNISYDITGLVKSVEVRGMDTAKGTMVTAISSASNKTSMGNKTKALIAQSQKVYIDPGATAKKTAQQRADSLMEDISYRFGYLEGECIGIPELKPGFNIEIAGMGKPVDNQFYLTNVRHVLSDKDGYRTMITGKAAALS